MYASLVLAAFALNALTAVWRPAALVALLALPVAVRPVAAVLGGASGAALIPVLGDTGRLQMVVGALATVGLAVGSGVV